ncbi:MAG: BamA/TamA family outer membrane protein [Polyangiales bacterium]
MKRTLVAIASAILFAAPPGRAQEEQPKPVPVAPPPSGKAEIPSTPESEAKPPAPVVVGEPTEKRPPVPPGESPERTLPEYDPRGPEKTTVGDVVVWVPRVVLFPLYLVHEYVVREPLGWLASTAERKKWHIKIYDFLTTSDHKAGIFPTAYADFGLRPSVGLYAFADDVIAKGNDLRAHFGTWGPHWINAGITDRVHLHNDATVAVIASYWKQLDALFYGLGPRSTNDTKSRYAKKIADVGVEYDLSLGFWSYFRVRAGWRQGRFDASGCCGVDLSQRVADGQLTLPPGFDGYDISYQSTRLTLDSRTRRPHPESGVRLELGFDDMQQPMANGRNWVRYGGGLTGFLDVGRARILGLRTVVAFADPVRGDDIPFTEQVVLGGATEMRGFLPGRLVGRSGLVGELEYQWPVWAWLDGTLKASLGNVFDEHLQGFKPKLLRLSSGIGLRSKGNPDHGFELFTGFGTETFEDGFRVSSFRFVIGSTHGYYGF